MFSFRPSSFQRPLPAAAAVVALALAAGALPSADESLPLSTFLHRLQAALGRQQEAAQPATMLQARVTAESRSGVRRLRIRDFQFISDSERGFAGYNLGAGSWETEVGVLGSAVATEFLFQAASAGIALDAVDVVFTSRQDEGPRPAGQVAYPRNLEYTAYIVSPASNTELEALRVKVEDTSPVLTLVAGRQDIAHGTVVHTPSPAVADPNAPPGLRDFLVEKRAALLRRQAARTRRAEPPPPLRAHVRVEGGTGLRHIRAGEGRFQFLHDTPRTLAGFDLGPTVEEHQLGVMATCLTHIFEIQAAQRQVVLDALEVRVEGTLTPRGPGLPRLIDVRYSVHISSPASAQEIDELRKAVEAVCPIYNLLKQPQVITGRIIRERFEAAPSTASVPSRLVSGA